MSYPLRLAIRGLRFRFRQALISILGVFVGVLSLIVVLAVLNGLKQATVRHILETSGHLQVYNRESHQLENIDELCRTVESLEEVTACAPAVLAQAMVENEKEKAFSGVHLKGILPEAESRINPLHKSIVKGGFRFFGLNEVILGAELARQLLVEVDGMLNIVIPDGTVHEVRVVGLFETGMLNFDFETVLIPLGLAQKLFGYGEGASHLFVTTRNPLEVEGVAEAIRKATGRDVVTWKETNRLLMKVISLEQLVFLLVVVMTLFVASLGISNILTMMVYEKYQDIGILRSMGAPRSAILRIFLFQGLLIGLIGTLLGCVGGYALGTALRGVSIPVEIYQVDHLPVVFDGLQFLGVALLASLVSLAASYLPARRAVSIDPMDAIRYYV